MSATSLSDLPSGEDRVSNVLKWILLAVAVITFIVFFWATAMTYEQAPPQPERFTDPSGAVVMTDADVVAGKAGFQKSDLMDYGSLYGMGSYFGPDYTAFALRRLAGLTEDNLAQTQVSKNFDALGPEQQATIRDAMRRQLRGVDLTRREVALPAELAAAIVTLRSEIVKNLATVDLATGWTPAYSLSPEEAHQTGDFLIYSALTTVACRPDTPWSWTQNWPYE